MPIGQKNALFLLNIPPSLLVNYRPLRHNQFSIVNMKRKSCKMKNRRIAWLLLMLLTIPLGLFAQNITVKGVVTDSEGEPIIGASVIEKGKSGNGTITNLDGNFTLNVSGKNKKLVISYIGMTTQEVDAATGKVIKVVLHDDAQALDEVVVIGYGTSKRGET